MTCVFDWRMYGTRRKGGHLSAGDRDHIHGGWTLLFDASVFGSGNADALAGGGDHGWRSSGDRFVSTAQECRCVGMDAVQRNHHVFSRRDNLVSLAIEFRVVHRDSRGINTLNDRHDATDVRFHRAKAQQVGGEVVGEVHF